ncbi:LysR family transcriptional regulator [Ferrimonas pelagia]|uniref:HTH lysR-type domain-containing protein n=1 Tax=Ferrimonas pelagia TaxID=1177826 RepID=A0ABP9EHS7_9GAMM
MFSYELLVAFCATYEEKSFSAAGRKLHKDRTTIREQVRAIEDTYDVSLFEIVGKRAQPTAAADHIYAQSKHLLHSTEKLTRSFELLFNEALLELTLYHDGFLPRSLAIKIEQAITAHSPNVRTNWLLGEREAVFAQLQSSPNAIAFMPHNNASYFPPKEIAFRHVGYSEMGFYAGSGSDLRNLPRLSIEDLAAEKQYVCEDYVRFAPALFRLSPQHHLISDPDMLIEMVKHSGWTVIHRDLAQPHVKNGTLHELKVDEIANSPSLGLSLFYPHKLKENALIDRIRTCAEQHFQSRGY